MRKNISGEDVEQSSPFKTAKGKADDYANNPHKLNDLLDHATRKAESRKGPLTEIWDALMTCFRLLRAYANGRYRDIPWSSLVSIIASILYFVMPLDLIPDFILGLGFIDDAVLLGWIVNSVRCDIDDFVEWEKSNPSQEPEDAETDATPTSAGKTPN
ncbi:MAG: DUF1232 domain-containing protein [Gammaproteobacteria bacterium]|nr:DUF1232 domain-containing protein [Gammaproteobacteria bacterium]